MNFVPVITYFKNPNESSLAELIYELIIEIALSVVGVLLQAPASMLRQFRRPTRNLLAAWLCGCWVALTLAVPVVQAQQIGERTSTVDCVSAAVPTSTPYSDTSIDESLIRQALDSPKIDFVGQGVDGCGALQQRAYGSTALAMRGLSTCQPTLLDLGIALRL